MIWRTMTLILVGGLSGAAGLWISDRDPPTVSAAKPEVLTPTVQPGGYVRIKYTLLRRRSCAVKTERLLFDGDNVRYPLEDLTFEAAPASLGPDSYVSQVPIPRTFSQGQGRYRTISTYTCNLVHKWFWPIAGQPTEVEFKVWGEPVPLDLPIRIRP
jgi:hypothetical protein